MAQVIETIFRGEQRPLNPAWPIPWLVMTRWHKRPDIHNNDGYKNSTFKSSMCSDFFSAYRIVTSSHGNIFRISHWTSVDYSQKRRGMRSYDVVFLLLAWTVPLSRFRSLLTSLQCFAEAVRIPYWRDDVIKWKHFPCNWPFVRGIHRSPVNSPHKGQRRGALMFSLICAWINDWVNNREAGGLRRNHVHYDVIVVN